MFLTFSACPKGQGLETWYPILLLQSKLKLVKSPVWFFLSPCRSVLCPLLLVVWLTESGHEIWHSDPAEGAAKFNQDDAQICRYPKKNRSSGCSKNDASKFVWFQSGPLFLGKMRWVASKFWAFLKSQAAVTEATGVRTAKPASFIQIRCLFRPGNLDSWLVWYIRCITHRTHVCYIW